MVKKIFYHTRPLQNIKSIYHKIDYLFGVVVRMSDHHPRGLRYYFQLYPRNFSGNIRSEQGPLNLVRTFG